jgi:soluble lytic murein transglycosylase-like protein
MTARVPVAGSCLSLVLAAGAAGQPSPSAPLPHDARATVQALVQTTQRLDGEIAAWRGSRTAKPPTALTLDALYQQRIYRLLSRKTVLARETLLRLPSLLRRFASDIVTAHRQLVAITPPLRLGSVRVGPAAPPGDLLRFYREAQRRFGVPWNVLAAVNLVESAFGKLRSASAAGAQGPMQFMPSSWRTYGLGGNVHDPHDAIIGAANYLRAAGARSNVRRALHAYNPSPLYVDAVLRYAREISLDTNAFYDFYGWQVFVRTPAGERRLTGPGVP